MNTRIQWFPGHMHKAQKEIRQVLSGIDVVIELLDARIPFSSQNPMLSEIRGDKPCVRLLNKADLADPGLTQQWLAALGNNNASQRNTSQRNTTQRNTTQAKKTQGDTTERDTPGNNTAKIEVLATSTEDASVFKHVSQRCRKLVPRSTSTRPVHALIVGIPNVGKSTVINQLAGRTIARTGNEPAITRAQQRVDIGDGVVLRDTPGVLWANLENRNSGFRLAVTGAIRDTAIDSADVAVFAVEQLHKRYPGRLQQRYNVELPADIEAVTALEIIGRQRGALVRGAHVDFDRVGKLLLTDIRSGSLGRITLESPADSEAELDILAERRLQKQQQKERRHAERQSNQQQKIKAKRKRN